MKRFYKQVSVEGTAAGHAVRLDGKAIKTPGKATLLLPTAALAEAVATEWDMQGPDIDPATMPLTRHANTVIDRITPQRMAVVAEISKFGGSDLLCYRASHPADLVALQADLWDPLLAWAGTVLGAHLRVTAGISAVDQPPEALAALKAAVAANGDWQLAALHEAVTLSGSLVIGLALSHGAVTVEAAWRAGQLDELFQADRWGEDEQAAQNRQARREALAVAARLFHLLALN